MFLLAELQQDSKETTLTAGAGSLQFTYRFVAAFNETRSCYVVMIIIIFGDDYSNSYCANCDNSHKIMRKNVSNEFLFFLIKLSGIVDSDWSITPSISGQVFLHNNH